MDYDHIILSIVGSHAGEEIKDIFTRKQQEIERSSLSFWLIHSFKARPYTVQEFCKEAEGEVYCFFITGSSLTAARPTVVAHQAKEFSIDQKEWERFPRGIKVTGKINLQATALVFDDIVLPKTPILVDLWEYTETDSSPVQFQLGASTICVSKHPSSVGTKTRFRKILAIGKFSAPYGVWVR